jgi:hypothetical protein
VVAEQQNIFESYPSGCSEQVNNISLSDIMCPFLIDSIPAADVPMTQNIFSNTQ